MYNKNDLVYVYITDLKLTIPSLGLNENRFGKIINIKNVGKDMYDYIVKCKNNNTMIIKSYDNSFNICNIEELIDCVYTSNANEKMKDKNIELINKILKY